MTYATNDETIVKGMPDMSNEEIVDQIQKGIEVTTNQERLWKRNKPFVILCIKKYVGSCDNQDFEDFVNEGFIGMMTAASRYKTDRGANFLTYAEYHIKNALYRYKELNTYTVRVPEYLKTRMRELVKLRKEFREEHQREPDQEEIRKALCISAWSLRHLEKTMLNMYTKSLDDYVSSDGDVKLIDLLASDEKIDELAGGSQYHKELHSALEDALSILDQRTAMMIRSVFYNQRGYKGTAKIFNCSRQAVDERIKKGFYQILHSKHREKLESFMWNGYHVDPRRLSDYVDMEEIDNMGSEFLL